MILNEFFDSNRKPLVVAESDSGDTPIDSMTVRELAEYLGVSEQQVAQDVEHARDIAREKAKDLVEEFDLIESIIERLAELNGVAAEAIWEDLESLSNDELYVFAVTTPLMEDWQKVNKQDRTAGMSRKAVKAYRRENPGSKLKTAVTTKPSKLKRGSKASKRRKSYCSRSRGQMKMHSISCAKTPDKAICKARRRWNCESMDLGQGLAEAINPDITNPAFSHQQQIGDYLYVARYWGRRKNPIGLKISAYHGNKLIGRADLMYHSAPFDDFADPETTPNRMWLESEITEVNPKYQRQGIMSTMYAYARMLGNTVKPSQTRSDDAKAAWASWRQSGDKEHLTKMRAEGVAEGLNEFAPPGSGNNGDDGFSEETLKRLAAQWYNGDEDPRVESTLKAAGWEIGQDEGYDDEPGVFVVQSGDVNGHSYISWPAHELKQDMAEVSDATKQSYKSKAQAQVKALEPHAKKGEYRDIAQRAIDRRQRGLTRLAGCADAVAAQTLAPRVSEGLTVPEGRPALGQANITTLIQTYKRNEPFAELSFGNSGNLRINRQQMRLIMDHYLKLQTPEEKHDFVYETMSRMLKLIAMFDGYKIDVRSQIAVPPGQSSPVPGAQPQLFELDAGEVKDTRLSRALKQARAEFPTAGSDIEAFLKLVMSNDDRDLAAMNRMQAVNKKQSELLDRIQNIDQKQNQEIGNLESELDRVTQVNQNLERELNRIQSAKPGAANREPRKDTAQKPAAEKPAAKVDVPVGQDISTKAAKKTKAAAPSKVSYGLTPQYKTTLQPPKYSMPQLRAPAQAQLPAPAQAQTVTKQSDLFPDITDVIPRAVAPVANGTRRNPVISALDQDITDIFRPAANDEESQRQANAESRDPRQAIAHTDFDDPEWHEKVRGIGQRAKQGPLKTVWDEKRKVYRNVPVDRPPANNKPNMTEARLQRRAVLRQILES